MWRPVAPWAALTAVGVAWELREVRRGDSGATLTSCVRVVFHTRHPVGRLAFVASWSALTLWFIPHIVRPAPPKPPPTP